MWFKKKAYISGYNSNTAVDGTDWRTTYKYQSWSVSQTLPSAADASKYFYLPVSGYYGWDQLSRVGGYGYYWSSSADPIHSYDAYYLNFFSGDVTLDSAPRYNGWRVGGFE